MPPAVLRADERRITFPGVGLNGNEADMRAIDLVSDKRLSGAWCEQGAAARAFGPLPGGPSRPTALKKLMLAVAVAAFGLGLGGAAMASGESSESCAAYGSSWHTLPWETAQGQFGWDTSLIATTGDVFKVRVTSGSSGPAATGGRWSLVQGDVSTGDWVWTPIMQSRAVPGEINYRIPASGIVKSGVFIDDLTPDDSTVRISVSCVSAPPASVPTTSPAGLAALGLLVFGAAGVAARKRRGRR